MRIGGKQRKKENSPRIHTFCIKISQFLRGVNKKFCCALACLMIRLRVCVWRVDQLRQLFSMSLNASFHFILRIRLFRAAFSLSKTNLCGIDNLRKFIEPSCEISITNVIDWEINMLGREKGNETKKESKLEL